MASKKITFKDYLIKFAVAVSIGLVVLVVSQEYFFTIGPLRELEQKQIDERFTNRGVINIKDTAKVIILEQTQTTYSGIPYHWPWPRSVYAKVIENLNKAGVKAIGIDLIMSNPDQYSKANDSTVMNVIKKYRNVVVAGKVDYGEGTVSAPISMNDGSQIDLQSTAYKVTKKDENYSNIYFPADSSIGIVEVGSDNDAVVRRYYPMLLASSGESFVPTFSFAVLNKYFGQKSLNTVINDRENRCFRLHDRVIPKYDNQSMLLNFYGPSRTFKHFDFIDVLDDKEFKTKDEIEFQTDINTWDDPANGYLYSGIFKDKIVLIGSTMPEDKDIIPISFGQGKMKGDNLLNGVEVHATAIQNVLSNSYVIKEPATVEIVAIFVLAFFTFFLSSLLKEIKMKYSFLLEILNLVIVGAVLLGLRWLSFYMFNQHNYLTVNVSSNMSVLMAYVGATAFHFIRERRQKGMIKGMFSQYVNSTIVDELIIDPEKLQLGGQRKNLTVFFSDIAGFSTFSENKEPEELVSFLNEYLSEMTKVVFEHKGTLDKYVGDAVMAFWGAPIPNEDHAYYGCVSAIEMQRVLAELKEKWRREGQPLIHARMGLNTGDMVVGNVGGKQRFDYTVMGDAVNLASRLEGANKEYGTAIMISESTYEVVKDRFITRELDYLTVKGKNKPVKVYELLTYAGETLAPEVEESLKYYNEGLALYQAQKFIEAKELFEKAIAVNPNETPSKTYIKRCDLLYKNPPPADWDGVFHMTTK